MFWTSSFSVATRLPPWRRAAEVQTAFSGVRFLFRMFDNALPQRIEPVVGVVEDLIEDDGQSLAVRRIDQRSQIVGRAEVALDGEIERRVVAERIGSLRRRKFRQRHDRQCRHAKSLEVAVANALGNPCEPAAIRCVDIGIALRKTVHAELVENQLREIRRLPPLVGPHEA